MARKAVIQVTDDIDGKPLDIDGYETVRFGVDGKFYEFDASPKNAEKFRAEMEKYIAVSAKVGRQTGRRGSTTRVPSNAKTIRAWAESNGHEVPERGRIPKSVVEAFEAAN